MSSPMPPVYRKTVIQEAVAGEFIIGVTGVAKGFGGRCAPEQYWYFFGTVVAYF